MRTYEFDLERTVPAPVEQVFARLVDIDGHNEWMPRRGSMLRRTRQTSSGAAAVGTTYVDESPLGDLPGEIVELEAPYAVVYHWWDRSKKGRLHSEGWPGYRLEATPDGGTVVHHHARLTTYGAYSLAMPVFRRMARRERRATIDALQASFARG